MCKNRRERIPDFNFSNLTYRLCGFEPFYDERGDQAMFQRILKCDYEFVTPWWDEVSENAKVGGTSSYRFLCHDLELMLISTKP